MTRRIVPALLLAFAALYLWQATHIPLDPWSAQEAINARTLPIIYGTILLGLSVIALWRGLGVVSATKIQRLRGLGVMVVLILGYGVLIPLAGIWPATACFVAAGLVAEGERRLPVLIATPLLIALAGWLLIELLLGVYLDPGSWWS